MPRFYFDVWEGDHLAHDDDGLELASLEAAELAATRAAAEIGKECLRKGCSEIGVQVRNQDGQVALSVAVSMTVRRRSHAAA